MSYIQAATFQELIADLTRDANRAQPRDPLQFCANWFNSRLEEQRSRLRDVFESTLQPTPSPTQNHHTTPHIPRSPKPIGLGPPPLLQPPPRETPSPYSTPAAPPMSTHHNSSSNLSPFGTLDIPGNAQLAYRHTHPLSHSQTGNPSPFANAIPEDEEYSEDGGTSSHASRSLPRRATSSPRSSPPFLGPPASALGRRVSVSAESIDPSSGPSAPLPFFQKTPDQMKRLQAAIANAFLFRNLDAKKRDAVLGAMKEMHFDRGERVITQGDDGDFFYVVDSGTLDCFVRAKTLENGQPSGSGIGGDNHPAYGKKVTTYTKGGCFGELALMYFAKRAATIITTSPCILWALDRLTFQTILLDISNRTRKSYEAFLRSVPILDSLTDQERAKLADVLQAREFNEGETVVREGDIGTEFYIIEEGQAMVYKRVQGDDGEGKEELVLRLKKGDYFGELALLHRAPRAATVRAAVRTDPSKPPVKLKVAALDGDAFTRLLGPLRELMERSAELNYHSPR